MLKISTIRRKQFNFLKSAWSNSIIFYDVFELTISNRCNPSNPPGTISGPSCKNATLYSGKTWCGGISDTAGVWATCLKVAKNIDKSVECSKAVFVIIKF